MPNFKGQWDNYKFDQINDIFLYFEVLEKNNIKKKMRKNQI